MYIVELLFNVYIILGTYTRIRITKKMMCMLRYLR